MIRHKGSCYCQKIQFSTEFDPMLIFNCHCLACKKVSGSPMSTAVVFNEAEVDFSGEMKFFSYKGETGKGVYKYFCDNCGCRILTKVDLIEGLIYIDMGVFDDWNIFEPKVEIWTKYKKNWLGEFGCIKESFEDNGTIERIQLCMENLDQRE